MYKVDLRYNDVTNFLFAVVVVILEAVVQRCYVKKVLEISQNSQETLVQESLF